MIYLRFLRASSASFDYILNHMLKYNCWKGTQDFVTSVCL